MLKELLQQETREEKHKKTNPKWFNKMAVGAYISITTLSVKGLNAPTKIHTGRMDTETKTCL